MPGQVDGTQEYQLWHLLHHLQDKVQFMVYRSLYCKMNCTQASKWLAELTYSLMNTLLLLLYTYLIINYSMFLLLYCTSYCALHCTLYKTLYTMYYTLLYQKTKVAIWDGLLTEVYTLPTTLPLLQCTVSVLWREEGCTVKYSLSPRESPRVFPRAQAIFHHISRLESQYRHFCFKIWNDLFEQ